MSTVRKCDICGQTADVYRSIDIKRFYVEGIFPWNIRSEFDVCDECLRKIKSMRTEQLKKEEVQNEYNK